MKNMKKMMIVGAALMLVGAGCFGGGAVEENNEEMMNAERVEIEDGSYVLDVEASSLAWEAGKAVGATHDGTFGLNGGTVRVVDGQFASVELEINMEAIEVLDLEGDGKDNLEGHLSGEDFFDVENFPTAQFSLTSTGDAESVMSEMTIVGDLSMKDQIADQEVMVNVEDTDAGFDVMGSFELDRTRWGITFGSGSFFDNLGDNVINDVANMELDLVFVAEGEEMEDESEEEAEEEMMDEDDAEEEDSSEDEE